MPFDEERIISVACVVSGHVAGLLPKERGERCTTNAQSVSHMGVLGFSESFSNLQLLRNQSHLPLRGAQRIVQEDAMLQVCRPVCGVPQDTDLEG
jgi:hypothetical protein